MKGKQNATKKRKEPEKPDEHDEQDEPPDEPPPQRDDANEPVVAASSGARLSHRSPGPSSPLETHSDSSTSTSVRSSSSLRFAAAPSRPIACAVKRGSIRCSEAISPHCSAAAARTRLALAIAAGATCCRVPSGLQSVVGSSVIALPVNLAGFSLPFSLLDK